MTLGLVAEDRLRHLRRGEKLPVVKGRCRLCGIKRPPRRRGYCSDSCQDAYLMATDSRYVRVRVWQRDEGVCRGCGLDCDNLEKRLWGYSTMTKMAAKGSLPERGMRTSMELRVALVTELKNFGFALNPGVVTTLWEADHVVPVVDGGSFLLPNLQTLCAPDHRNKTSLESGWRAKREKLVGRKTVATRAARGLSRRKR